jgi:hypothetical protein
MTEKLVRNATVIRDTLHNACDCGELLFLVTPYMRFEANFLLLDQDCVHVTATMSKEDAMYGLRSAGLHMRFPSGHEFFDAPTKLIGIGMAKGRQSLRLAIPDSMGDDDYRCSCRVEPVGRIAVTFSSRHYDLLMGTMVNVSTTGIRLYSLKLLEEGDVRVDDEIHVAFTLTPDIVVNCKAKVRYQNDRLLGMEFRPKPSGALLDSFSRWIFQRREEIRLQNRPRPGPDDLIKDDSAQAVAAAKPSLALVSGSAELEASLRALGADLPPLRRYAPNMQSLKELAGVPKTLVLFHVAAITHEDRKRLKILVDALSGKTPFVLVGTGIDNAQLAAMGSELKALASYPMGATSGNFLLRLLQGIFRRTFPEA